MLEYGNESLILSFLNNNVPWLSLKGASSYIYELYKIIFLPLQFAEIAILSNGRYPEFFQLSGHQDFYETWASNSLQTFYPKNIFFQ